MKTVLITGASRGIGKALTERFLDNGDSVIGTSTSGKGTFEHKNLKFFQLDLSDSVSIEKSIKLITDFKGSIDILINNAGIAVEEENDNAIIVVDYLRRILEVNLIGTVDFTERIIPHIKLGGQIVNISSRAGSLGHTRYKMNYPGYRISKAALNMVTRILAMRLEDKIKVLSVHPGWVQTDMGGEGAPLSPKEAAEDIFNIINSNVESGQFWFKDEKFPW